MTDKIIELIKNKIVTIYFILLFILLAIIYFPTFFNAPRSDWWESLYFFHSIYSSSMPYQWLQIFNTDCFGHVTFRPLAHMILFLQHAVFGSRFIFMHIINFFLYFCSLLLLYRFAILFGFNRMLTALFIGLFAFLFSHFDIISWTVHSHLILGFCLFLSGFIMYVHFLKTGKKMFLFIIIAFLIGMLCYEAFIFWPLAIIFLSNIKSITNLNKFSNTKLVKSNLVIIGTTYCFYAGIFILTRLISMYDDTWRQTYALVSELSSIKRIFESFCAVSFNTLYNGIIVNLIPTVTASLRLDIHSSNVRMGGLLDVYRPVLGFAMKVSSVIIVLLIVGIVTYLVKQKRFDTLKTFILFSLLLFSFSFLLFHFKYFSNREYFYDFQQFRYQYISNAWIVLTALLFIDRAVTHISKRKIKVITYILILMITVMNIYHTIPCIRFETHQMAPLNRMLVNIKKGIKSKQINENNKIYIADNIVHEFPEMCWNVEIGRFMKGTYQWLFDKREIKYFSSTLKEASWIVDKKNFNVKSRINNVEP